MAGVSAAKRRTSLTLDPCAYVFARKPAEASAYAFVAPHSVTPFANGSEACLSQAGICFFAFCSRSQCARGRTSELRLTPIVNE